MDKKSCIAGYFTRLFFLANKLHKALPYIIRSQEWKLTTLLPVSFCIAMIRSRAASTCALCPVMTMTSLSLPSDGSSILVSVSSRICCKNKSQLVRQTNFRQQQDKNTYSWLAHDIIKIQKSKLYILQSCF